MLTPGQAIAAIAVMAVVTFLTRALPFLLFDHGGTPPKVVLYLGRVLPPAVIASLVTVGLHLWKRNNLLSIFGGTILYMVLVQAVFV